MVSCPEDVLSEQVPQVHGAMNNGEQINDDIEEDDHIDHMVEDDVRFLSFKKYDLRILSERITCTEKITRDKRHKEFSLGKP